MSKNFPRLFEAGSIGKLQLSNRIIKSPTITSYGNWDGTISDRALRFYEELALGGTGLIIVEMTYIDEKGSKSHANELGIANPDFNQGWALLAQRIQECGAKAGVQLSHAGIQRELAYHIKSPSPLSPELLARLRLRSPAEALSVEEIAEIEDAFAEGALTAKKVGFDMVEIHGGHGYLITEFLSSLINKRTDSYGGTLQNRMNFLLRIIDKTRQKVGPDFPLGVRLSASEYTPGGITIEDSIEIAKAVEKAGVNILHISGGSRYGRGDLIAPPAYHPEALHVWASAAIKKAVNIPVIASGAIATPENAEQILEEGKADFIGLARELIADAYFAQKAREDRPEDIVPCIRCNEGCLRGERRGFGGIRCTVNVAVGKEDKFRIQPAGHSKKVAIVGGGPGGLEAARVAALSGHLVTLFEKGSLGGRLNEAGVPEFKKSIKRLINYYDSQMKKLKVNVIYREVDTKYFVENKFDAIIVAIGSVPAGLKVPGSNNQIVMEALDVLNRNADPGNKVIVIGGGLVGCDLSLFLIEQGKEVVMIEMLGEIGKDMEFLEKQAFFIKVADKKFHTYTNATVQKILDNGVVFIDRDNQTHQVQGDSVILATGFYPRELSGITKLKDIGTQVCFVGDCVSPRKIFDAIHEGHIAVRNLKFCVV